MISIPIPKEVTLVINIKQELFNFKIELFVILAINIYRNNL